MVDIFGSGPLFSGRPPPVCPVPVAIANAYWAQEPLLLDDMGCQVGVETAKLTTVMKDKKTESTKSYDTIKLGIDAHSKWYYVARQLDGATPQPVQKMELDEIMTKLK
ncbi:MAG: hypothetical protein ACJAVK_002081 [Akkermansiaceae bacterium]